MPLSPSGDIIGAGGGLVAIEPDFSLTISGLDDSLTGAFVDDDALDTVIEPVELFDTLALVATAAADVQICLDEFVFLTPMVPQVGVSAIAAQLINGPCITIPSMVQNVLPQTPEETVPMPDFLNGKGGKRARFMGLARW